MTLTRQAPTYLYSVLLMLVSISSVFAADPAPSQPDHWPMWHATPWPHFWWIFPFLFFIFIVVMMIFMMRRGGWGCMWCNRWRSRSEQDDLMKRTLGGSSESALDILNKRYAKGEIDKEEYEEKRAAIIRPG